MCAVRQAEVADLPPMAIASSRSHEAVLPTMPSAVGMGRQGGYERYLSNACSDCLANPDGLNILALWRTQACTRGLWRRPS